MKKQKKFKECLSAAMIPVVSPLKLDADFPAVTTIVISGTKYPQCLNKARVRD